MSHISDDGEMDHFTSFIQRDAVLECKIVTLTEKINSSKKELVNINRKIEEEKAVYNQISLDVEKSQALELQARYRIGRLNESKELTAKVSSALFEQVTTEKQRLEEARQKYTTSINNQLTRWEEYKKMYNTLPMAKDVENVSVENKIDVIDKMKKEKELDDLRKKMEIIETLKGERERVFRAKIKESEMLIEKLKQLKETLENQKEQLLKEIEEKKTIKSSIIANGKKDSRKISLGGKRSGDFNTEVTSIVARDYNINKTRCSLSFQMPELPVLQLSQSPAPLKKMRRIDMVDTTLQRPNPLTFPTTSKSPSNIMSNFNKSFSKNKGVLKLISSNMTTHSLRNIQVKSFSRVANQPGKENQQRHWDQVKPLAEDVGQSENVLSENLSPDTCDNRNNMSHPVNNVVNSPVIMVDDDVSNDSPQDVHMEEAFQVPVAAQSRGKFPHGNKDNLGDDGYCSQSQPLTQTQPLTQSQPKKNVFGVVRNAVCNNGTNGQDVTGSASLNQDELIESDSQRSDNDTPESRASLKTTEETHSKYFSEKQAEVGVAKPSTSSGYTGGRRVFKSPPPPPKRPNPIGGNQGSAVISEPDRFFGNKDTLQSVRNVSDMAIDKENDGKNQSEMSDYMNNLSDSRAQDSNVLSSWAVSPSPPPRNTSEMAFNNSYLNMLSPPLPQQSVDEGPSTSTRPSLAKSPTPMSFFGATRSPEKNTGGFNFTSSLNTKSSFFSMFK